MYDDYLIGTPVSRYPTGNGYWKVDPIPGKIVGLSNGHIIVQDDGTDRRIHYPQDMLGYLLRDKS